MTKAKTAKPPRTDPPATLSAPAQQWWSALRVEYDISDAAGLMLLASALSSWDLAEKASATIRKEGLMVSGQRGTRVHPLVVVERNARAGFHAAMKLLNLETTPLHDAPQGRPAGFPVPGGGRSYA